MLDIAITGTGIVSALGLDVEAFHSRLMAGETAIRPAPWMPADGRKAWWAAVTGFVPRDWMDAQVEAGTDLFAQFALAATQQAVLQAGLTRLDVERTGVLHGTSIGGARAVMKAQHLLDTQGPDAIPRKTQIQIWPNMAAAQIAMRYGLHGPNLTVTTACASSLDAIGTAARLIAGGQADVVIAGATEGGLSLAGGDADGDFVPAMFHTSTLYGMDAPSDDPRRAMLPFDAKRNGIVVGEGSAIVVLERGDHARTRGAPILGYVRGYGSLADAFHPSSPEPTGKWEARAMQLALQDAGIDAGAVDALIAHATGTPKGDTAEIRAINQVHGGRRRERLPVASIKGHIGHSGASSGGMAIITGLLGMREGRFVHTANTDEPDPEAAFDIVIQAPRAIAYRTLQVNAFGFGGQNASLIVTRD
ncbi:beta-ketoacyl-[acyl-carrier-protein] synthase family protein [Vineibacter terrae]|uniref:Beta-ketoacyl-[acyl-carrier-protein] synthase family protein n=1 Tax=Vineibacter terrae TaxID=2586908 RepID=A0A5C8PBI1_9HYPH|nr:beta-ketoacyl-[acyl-carrier-protein] synthase family protein [Vineibacter terrae]TXL70718.1 beta-ketoacyl-[acyl-carrier-protein] synthase family protein [Vineibacter terrae]